MLGYPDLPELPRDELRIVLLGAGQAYPAEYGKRRQILDGLRARGYQHAALGEDALGDDPSVAIHVALLALVQHGSVDLILVLDTAPAPLAELAVLSLDRHAREITRVWCKREFLSARRSTPSDVVKLFEYRPFGEDEFAQCDLLAEFVAAAERACLNKAQDEGRLPGLPLFPFPSPS